MPRICEFYGIVITMYFVDHPPPHFHVIYAEYEAEVSIEPVEIVEGQLPRRVLSLVREWAAEHLPELRDNWERARKQQPLQRIAPLS